MPDNLLKFLISDTFTDSLAKLTGDEQKAVKTTAFDLQMNPVNSGMSLHKIDRARDPNFWSVRVSSDLRLIVHRTDASFLLCYVDHHDNAYKWAQNRKLETHPKTGAAQIVELRETVLEIQVPRYVDSPIPSLALPLIFARFSDDDLLTFGVPNDWLEEVRKADADTLLDIGDHLPAEAAEALLAIAVGGKPKLQESALVVNPFEHPDAQRRFRVMANAEELERAFEYPWDKWTVFLHPAQRAMVERDYNGPARVSGSAGTGKTIVALHRAVYLARTNPSARVLLATFSAPLANALKAKLKCLLSSEPGLSEFIEVLSLDSIGEKLYGIKFGKPQFADQLAIQSMLADISAGFPGLNLTQRFLMSEWEDIVDTWQLKSWEDYRDVSRLGRKTRLPEKRRGTLWPVYEALLDRLGASGAITRAEMYTRLASALREEKRPPYNFAIIDEAQDISVPQLRFLAALVPDKPDSLFFAGDLGQRIFQLPFSWKSLGVDVRGRSRTLHVNYRTSHQIRTKADFLLGPEVADVDGNVEDRRGAVSVFNGPPPSVQVFENEEVEIEGVAKWLQEQNIVKADYHEIGVFVRSTAQLGRAVAAATKAGLPYQTLDENANVAAGLATICPMHLAKGLEFRIVVVMACDDEIIPLQERIESAVDESDLIEVYQTERHLLYVACTRARDRLFVTAVSPESEYLDDLRQ